MAKTYDSGWMNRENGDKTTVNVISSGVVTGATVQWRPWSETVYAENYRNYGTPGGASTSWVQEIFNFPDVPAGYVFDSHRAEFVLGYLFAHSMAMEFDAALPKQGGGWERWGSTGIYQFIGDSGHRRATRSTSRQYNQCGGELTRTQGSGYVRFGRSGVGGFRMVTRGRKTLHTHNASIGYVIETGNITTETAQRNITLGAFNNFKSKTFTHSFSTGDNYSGRGRVRIRIEYVDPANVSTADAEDVGPDHATIGGSLSNTGGGTTRRFLQWGKTTSYGQTLDLGVGGVGSFTSTIAGLEVNQKYYYRAYVTNEAGTWYGARKEFTTEALTPTVRTLTADDIQYTSARLHGEITYLGGWLSSRHFEWGETPAFGNQAQVSGLMEEGTYNHTVTNLNYETKIYYRAFGVNQAGEGYGQTRTFETPYPYIYAPVIVSPAFGTEMVEDIPVYEFILTENATNPADKYHARVRVSSYVSLEPTVQVLESDGGAGTWEYHDGSTWQAFPTEGVDPGTTVRVTPTQGLAVGPWYWDCASVEATGEKRLGINSSYSIIRVLLTVEGLYTLLTGVSPEYEWDIYNQIKIIETCNGEMGSIVFEISNLPFDDGGTEKQAQDVIEYGDRVLLGVRDRIGSTEEFLGRVRRKEPSGDLLRVTAILADGILGERRIKTDYPDDVKTIIGYDDASTWINITSLDEVGDKTQVTAAGHGMSDGDEVLIRGTDRYDRRWTVESTTDNTFIIDRSHDVEATLGECVPVDDAMLEVTANLHGFGNGDRVQIRESTHYDGVYVVTNVTTDTFEINYLLVDDDAAPVGVVGALEDIGVTVKKIIDNYCQGIEATTARVDTETGYLAPVSALGKTPARVMEGIRRNYNVFYYVDKDAYLHFYKPDVIESEPDPQIVIRRGDD